MKNIIYLKGDATHPQTNDNCFITHICNDIGKWGKGFVLAISKRWSKPERCYKKWYNTILKPDIDLDIAYGEFKLGAVQYIDVQYRDGNPATWVVNMIAQKGIKNSTNPHPLSYEALEECLYSVNQHAYIIGSSIHMPRIGCGLGGGSWDKVEPLIIKCLSKENKQVYVYDLV